ncbi:MAG: glycosyltransferase family 4 protein [candidate division WOR-3 bacterium]
MRVLHVIYSGQTGGISRFVEHLFTAQKETLDPALAFGRAEGPLWQRAAEQAWLAYDLGIRRGWPVNPLKTKRAERIFSGFDVIHFHYFQPVLAKVALRTRARIIFTEHGMFDRSRNWLVRSIKTRAKASFLSNARVRAIANSRFTAGRIRELYGTEAKVIPVGEFLSDIKPRMTRQEVRESLGLSREDFVVSYLGRLAGMKRLDRLIESTRGLQVKLLIIGGGSHKLNLPDRAIHTGLAENPFDYLGASDLLVMPAEGEPFGLSALEAMAMGIPVLCFCDGGGVCELLEDYPELMAKDTDDMREKIARFIREPEEARYTGELLKRRAVSYDITRIAQVYQEIYEGTL